LGHSARGHGASVLGALRLPRIAAACAVVLGGLVVVASSVASSPGAGAATGSVLLDETFTGTSAASPNIVPLGNACLTAATTAPPAGRSRLGVCSSRVQSPPATTPGYLQLTDASNNVTGAILYNRALPANGGIQITFQQYQYGGCIGQGGSCSGADGIGFFIVNGAADLTATGANGGSLGYAQKVGVPGVASGFVGVGLDAYGNFANDLEGRGTGCASRSPYTGLQPNAIGIRGPGDGLTGYCFVSANTSLPGNLRSSTATGSNIASATRTVQITLTPGASPTITVGMDFTGGTNFQTVLTYHSSTPLPPTFKFGLSGSTGGSRDVHLIRNLTVTSLVPLPEINLVKQVAITTPPQPPAYTLGSTVPYQFVVTNTGVEDLSNVVVDDPSVGNLQCPATTLGPAGSPTSTMVCTGTHVVNSTDIISPTLTNTATATGANSIGETVSSTSSVTVDLVSMPVLTKTAVDPVVTAGNPIAFNITLANPGPPTPLSGLNLTDRLPAAPGVNWTISNQYGPATCSITGAPPTQTLDCGTFTLQVAQSQFVQVSSATAVTSPCSTLSNTATATSPVVATLTATDQVVVDCRGSLTVTKTINGPAAGQQGQVVIRTQCDGVTLSPDLVIPDGETSPATITYTNLTAGQQCTASEIEDGSSATVAVATVGVNQTMTISPGADDTLPITDTFTPAPGSLTLTKLIAGPAAGQQGQVDVQVTCEIDGSTSFSGTFSVPANSAAGLYSHTFDDIPAASVCTVIETATGATGAVNVSTTGTPQTITVPAGGAEQAGQIADIYTFAPGALTITKAITGSAAGQQGQITIQAVCGGTALTPEFVIPAGTTASPQSQTYGALPAGQECTVTELDNGSTPTVEGITTGDGQTTTIPAGGTAMLSMSDAYEPRPAGSLTVTKTITGPAAGQQGQVDISTVCNGVAETPDLTVPAGSPPGDYSQLYQGVPPNASCTVTEDANGSTPAVTASTSPPSPQTVTVPSGEGAAVTYIDTYDFVPGSLRVSKTIAGPSAGQQGEVTVETDCDGVILSPVLTIPAGTGPGTTSQTYTGIPGNTVCTASETANGNTNAVEVTTTGDNGVPVMVPAGGTAAAAITDSYVPIFGALDVEKLIAGAAAGKQGEVTIGVSCVLGDTPTFSGDFVIPAGTSGPSASDRFDAIPSGSVCTVTETSDGSTSAVTATVLGSPQSVTIDPDATTPVQFTDLYGFARGSLTVSKTIAGPEAGRQTVVRIHTACNGAPLDPDLVIPAGTAATTMSQTYPNLPGQATCVVTELLDGSTETVRATVVGSPQFLSIPPGGNATAHLTDTYGLARGALVVTKTVTGSAAGLQGQIVIGVACNGSPLTPDLVLPAGTAAGTHTEVFTPLPAGTACRATELSDGANGSSTVAISGSGTTHTVPPAGPVTASLTDQYGPVLQLAFTGLPVPGLVGWSVIAIASGLVLVGAAGRRRRRPARNGPSG
jgi:hypothetical protein